MTFLLDNFWKLILLVVVAVGGWFGWEKYEQKDEWNHEIGKIRTAFAQFKAGSKSDEEEVHTAYWRLLTAIKDYQTGTTKGTIKPIAPENLDSTIVRTKEEEAMEWMFDAAMKQVGEGNSNARGAFKEALLDNLKQCDNLGIFDSDANINAMLKGQNPVIKEGIYKGDHLVISQRLPINVAREAYNEPANFVLMPETVAAVESPEMGMKERETAILLKNAGLIGQNSYEMVNRMVEDAKR